MPPVYGGAPKCPTCGKAVYFAEQVIGPQGSYHKACLKCVACGKALEPRLLLDHDGQAYCKSCHGKAFGAKGYGAGGALVGEYAPRPSLTPTSSPTRPSVATAAPQPAQSPTPAARPVPSVPTPAPARTEAGTARRPLPMPPVAPPKPASIFASTSTSRNTAGPPPPTPPRPASLQPTPTTSAASPTQAGKPSTPSFDAHSTRLSPHPPPLLPPPVPSLHSLPLLHLPLPAYHAESLLLPSLGGLIHRSCFRCAGCGGRLELGREVVRGGEGWCRGCYRERWGVGGGLGGMTRPNLF
uniref:BY PROTMAP: gi/647402062/emb/CDR48370.1/ RHTO0S17e02190g1_1 [Rhodosporidium toruloides] n=1 Tax=Rhodotorula toruloides TaxID=5286 RepID=A0A0K3CL49_RHOTO